MSQLSAEEQLESVRRGTLEIVGADELRSRLADSLKTGRPLRVKLTLDAGNPTVHLGHVVVLRKLRQFQQMGHRPVVVVGSFSTLVHSASDIVPGEGSAGEDELAERSRVFLEQVGRIIDLDEAEVVLDASWYRRMSLDEFVRACSGLTVDDLVGLRGEEDPDEEAPRGLDALFAPLVAAYDSVVVGADVEIVGADRTDDLRLARTLQVRKGLAPEVGVVMPMLCGADGELKMSTGIGNQIVLTEAPSRMYGQIMAIPDARLGSTFELLTDVPERELAALLADGADLRRAREMLAHRLVREYYNSASADVAAGEFERALRRPGVSDEVPTHVVSRDLLTDGRIGIVELLVRCGFARDAREARRSVAQGRTYVDGRRVTDVEGVVSPGSGCMIQVGSRRFTRVLIK